MRFSLATLGFLSLWASAAPVGEPPILDDAAEDSGCHPEEQDCEVVEEVEEIPPFDFGRLPAELEAASSASRRLPIGERMAAISAPLLGLPTMDGVTGEGVPPDTDPPARYDVFDCLTFVEEVLALAMAPDPSYAGMYRSALRFREGRPSYVDRNHFFQAEWVRNNVESGFLVDITATLGPVEILEKDVEPSTWQRWRRRPWFALADERFPVGRLEVPVLPLHEALEVMDRIPTGALVVTVRIPLPHVPILVTHVGIALEGEVPLMRHATRMGDRRVRDDRLEWYLEHLSHYKNWPVAGIQVLMPVEQGPRI